MIFAFRNNRHIEFMKYCFYVLTLLVLCSAKPSNDKVELTVVIQGLDVCKGKVAIELIDSKEVPIAEYWLFVESNAVELKVSDLTIGDYALRFFHDENDNGVMDKNWLGIPTEAFGFSNDAKVKLGPPGFKEMSFRVNTNMEIVVNARRL